MDTETGLDMKILKWRWYEDRLHCKTLFLEHVSNIISEDDVWIMKKFELDNQLLNERWIRETRDEGLFGRVCSTWCVCTRHNLSRSNVITKY